MTASGKAVEREPIQGIFRLHRCYYWAKTDRPPAYPYDYAISQGQVCTVEFRMLLRMGPMAIGPL